MNRTCTYRQKILNTRYKIKYCSNRCQIDHKHDLFIDDWRKGKVNGTIGINVKAMSGHLRRYLLKHYGEKCSLCGWNQRNPITGRVPLEVDHIDGDSLNSVENNLRLLCPNCHSLTPFFRNLNKGKGRKWRMDKYIRNSINSSTNIAF